MAVPVPPVPSHVRASDPALANFLDLLNQAVRSTERTADEANRRNLLATAQPLDATEAIPSLTAWLVTEGGTTANVPDPPEDATFDESNGSFTSSNNWVHPKPTRNPLTQQLWESSSYGLVAWSEPRLADPVSVTRTYYRRAPARPERPDNVPASSA